VQKRSRPRQKAAVLEPDLIPVLSCMFLLIPALLLAMEIASLAAITVSPPKFVSTPGADPGKDEHLEFSVMVRGDGFVANVGRVGSPNQAETEIEVVGSDHDYAALERLALELKQRHRAETRVNITAEGDIPFQTIVRTMDALRGHECSLADASMHAPDECLFWDVVVES
jgi:biopolymer transport protein ExbD